MPKREDDDYDDEEEDEEDDDEQKKKIEESLLRLFTIFFKCRIKSVLKSGTYVALHFYF